MDNEWRWYHFGEAFRLFTAYEGKTDLMREIAAPVQGPDVPEALSPLETMLPTNGRARMQQTGLIDAIHRHAAYPQWTPWPQGLHFGLRRIPPNRPDLKFLEGEMIVRRNPEEVFLIWPFPFQTNGVEVRIAS